MQVRQGQNPKSKSAAKLGSLEQSTGDPTRACATASQKVGAFTSPQRLLHEPHGWHCCSACLARSRNSAADPKAGGSVAPGPRDVRPHESWAIGRSGDPFVSQRAPAGYQRCSRRWITRKRCLRAPGARDHGHIAFEETTDRTERAESSMFSRRACRTRLMEGPRIPQNTQNAFWSPQTTQITQKGFFFATFQPPTRACGRQSRSHRRKSVESSLESCPPPSGGGYEIPNP